MPSKLTIPGPNAHIFRLKKYNITIHFLFEHEINVTLLMLLCFLSLTVGQHCYCGGRSNDRCDLLRGPPFYCQGGGSVGLFVKENLFLNSHRKKVFLAISEINALVHFFVH